MREVLEKNRKEKVERVHTDSFSRYFVRSEGSAHKNPLACPNLENGGEEWPLELS